MSEYGPLWTAVAVGACVLLCSLAVSAALTALVRRVALRVGFVDRPSDAKYHRQPTAYGGGIAIFGAFWGTIGAGVLIGWLLGRWDPPWLPDALGRHLPGMMARLPQVGVLLAGGLVLFVLGLVDDLRGLGPLVKLTVQIAVAVGVAACGIRATVFIANPLVGTVVTVLWIVGVTNSLNLLDNMDGLSSGVATIAAGIFLMIALQSQEWFVALYLLALIGALLGFLWHNFSPASIFMGDCGSLSIGYLLSTLAIVATFYRGGPVYGVVMPLLVLAVPLFDTISVVLLRIKLGRPIYVGDTNHLSHRLVRMGMSPRRAVLLIYLLTLCSGLGATLLNQVTPTGALVILVQTVFILVLVGLLERESRLARDRDDASADAPSQAPQEPGPDDQESAIA